MKNLIYIIPLLFALADAFVFRAKTDPITMGSFNLFLEASKMCYIAMVVSCILLGRKWQNKYILPLLFLHFIAKSIPFNIAAGLPWDYIGGGIFDTIIKVMTGANVYIWIFLQLILVTLSYLIISDKINLSKGEVPPYPNYVLWYYNKYPKWYMVGICIAAIFWGILNSALGKSAMLPTIIFNLFCIPTVVIALIAFIKKRKWEAENNL